MVTQSFKFRLGFAALFISLSFCSIYGQGTPEPYRDPFNHAVSALRERDYDLAVKLYSEAIDLFPKVDAFTPKSKVPEPDEGNLAPGEYRGLDDLYFGRFWAYLGKKQTAQAETDLQSSLIVLKTEVARDVKKAKLERQNVKIETEKKITNPNAYNSGLIKTAFLFGVIRQNCSRILSRYRNNPKIEHIQVPNEFLSNVFVVNSLAEVKRDCETAQFGEAEAYVFSMIEIKNKSANFTALRLANELVAAFPQNVDAYRLRVRVNEYLGDEREALRDVEKIKEMSPKDR